MISLQDFNKVFKNVPGSLNHSEESVIGGDILCQISPIDNNNFQQIDKDVNYLKIK